MDMDMSVSSVSPSPSPSPSRLREMGDAEVVVMGLSNDDVGAADVGVDVIAVGCAADNFRRSRSVANSARSAATVCSASCSRRAMATICDMGGGFS